MLAYAHGSLQYLSHNFIMPSTMASALYSNPDHVYDFMHCIQIKSAKRVVKCENLK